MVKSGLDAEQVIGFVNDLVAEKRASQEASAAALRSLLETAVTDAEQIAASIKMKAQTEAEAQATTIISQAEQEAEEVKRRAERAAQRATEDILAVAKSEAEITEVEAKQKALLFLLRAREDIEKEIGDEYKRVHSRLFSSLQNLLSEAQNIEAELKHKRLQLWENKTLELKKYEAGLLDTHQEAASSETMAPTDIEVGSELVSQREAQEPAQLREEPLPEKVEEPVQLREETLEQKIEEPTQLQEEPLVAKVEEPIQPQPEAVISEPVVEAAGELLERRLPGEKAARKEDEPARLELDSTASFIGEVEVEIATPVDPKMVYKLYDNLQTIPELKILHTRGSWDQGTVIAIVLEKPVPLVSLLSAMAGVGVTQSLPQKDSLVEGISSSLLGTKRKGTKRIRLTLKEPAP